MLPQLIDGGHDRIDYSLLQRALADGPAGRAAAVREARAVDATAVRPYPLPDAGMLPRPRARPS